MKGEAGQVQAAVVAPCGRCFVGGALLACAVQAGAVRQGRVQRGVPASGVLLAAWGLLLRGCGASWPRCMAKRWSGCAARVWGCGGGALLSAADLRVRGVRPYA